MGTGRSWDRWPLAVDGNPRSSKASGSGGVNGCFVFIFRCFLRCRRPSWECGWLLQRERRSLYFLRYFDINPDKIGGIALGGRRVSKIWQ